jgi:hypothetical protein
VVSLTGNALRAVFLGAMGPKPDSFGDGILENGNRVMSEDGAQGELGFFEGHGNNIQRFITELERINDNDKYLIFINFSKWLVNASRDLDSRKYCVVFDRFYKDSFDSLMSNKPILSEEKIRDGLNADVLQIFILLAKEIYLYLSMIGVYISPFNNHHVENIGKFDFLDGELLEGKSKEWLKKELYLLPHRSLYFSAKEEIGKLDEVIIKSDQSCGKIKKVTDDSFKSLEDFEKRAKNLEEKYNFLGLEHSFAEQSKAANENKKNAYNGMRILGWAAFGFFMIPILFGIFELFIWANSGNTVNIEDIILNRTIFSISAVLPVVFLILYFFRIAHLQYKSAAAVELQFELRRSICAFVVGYAESKKDMGENFNLDKFEALMFSGITPDPGNVPSTFDGLEGVAKLIEAARRK